MNIASLQESELPAALRLSTQAGWNHVEADLRRLRDLWPQTYLAGHINEQLVATTTLAILGGHVGWVGLVLVDEAHRRQGLGGEMLDAILSTAQDLGVKTLGLDATELGRPLYLTRGFRDVGTVDRWIRREATHQVSATSKPVRANSPPDADEWKQVLAMDLRAVRLDRSLLLNRLRTESAVIFRRLRQAPTGPISAFGMLRPGRVASHIGPVVAESEAAAEAILDQLVDHDVDKQALFIDVPTGRLKNWLERRGFELSRSVTRMQAGFRGPDLLGPRIFAACGFELG